MGEYLSVARGQVAVAADVCSQSGFVNRSLEHFSRSHPDPSDPVSFMFTFSYLFTGFLWILESNYRLGSQDHFCLPSPGGLSHQIKATWQLTLLWDRQVRRGAFRFLNLPRGCLHTPVLMRERGCDSRSCPCTAVARAACP